MIKNITIDENKEIVLSNNTVWTMVYRNQFGHDIVSTLTPVAASLADMVGGFFESVGEGGTVQFADVVKNIDGDRLIDAVIHLSGLEFVDILNITWAMAKAADNDLPDPTTWVTNLEVFPVDVIVPEVVKLAARGLLSSKKRIWLRQMVKKIQKAKPSTLIPLS